MSKSAKSVTQQVVLSTLSPKKNHITQQPLIEKAPKILEPISFDSLLLDAKLLKAIKDQGYTSPTPIQARAIPIALKGQDIMGAAQTGTGKTASFAIPIIQKLHTSPSGSASPARNPIRALILTPTRELADQVAKSVKTYAKYTALRSTVILGGLSMRTQINELRKGVEIVIATPGRLLDHVKQGNIKLNQVEVLVLDEADRMLDMGFLPDLQSILDLLPNSRQTLLFSATFSKEIEKLTSKYLRHPEKIEISQHLFYLYLFPHLHHQMKQ